MTDPLGQETLRQGVLVDRYEIEERIGAGAMSKVYRVRHQVLGTRHALKILNSDSAESRERIIEEGKIQAKLRHPNIVVVSDVLSVEGRPALLMDYISGPDLAQMLRSVSLPISEVVRLVHGIASGLAFAHQHGIVHRDLKPSNILLASDGIAAVPRICDFGIARWLAEEAARRTATGMAMGTPMYMAPEQLIGSFSVDQRADLYALGLILYEMACGEHPFHGHTMPATVAATAPHSYADPRTLRPELPEPLLDAIHRCLEPDPTRRIPSAEALLLLLAPLTPGDALPRIADRRTDALALLESKTLQRNASPKPSLAMGVVGLLLAASAGWAALEMGRRRQADETARAAEVRGAWRDEEARALAREEEGQPAEALALLRAAEAEAEAAGEDPDEVLNQDRLERLRAAGAASFVVPTPAQVLSIVAGGGSKLVAAGLQDGQILVIDADTGATLRAIPTGLGRVNNMLSVSGGKEVAAWTSPQDAAATGDEAAGIWDLQTGRRLHVLQHPYAGRVETLTVASRAAIAATSTREGEIRRWDLGSGVCETVQGVKLGKAALSASGRWLAGGGRQNGVGFTAVLEQGGRLRSLSKDKGVGAWCGFSPDDRWLACSGEPAQLWRTGSWTRKDLGSVVAQRGGLFSPDSTRLLFWDRLADPILIDLSTGHVLAPVSGHGHAVVKASFSKDGEEFSTTDEDDLVRTFRSLDGLLLRTLLGHRSSSYGVDFLPDGRLVTGGLDKTLRIWTETRGPSELLLFRDGVSDPVVSEDGALLAWGGRGEDLTVEPLRMHGALAPLARLGGAFAKRWAGPLLLLDLGEWIRAWRADTGPGWHAAAQGSQAIRLAALSPDAQRLVIVRSDGWAELSAATGQILAGQIQGRIASAAMRPGAHQVVLGPMDGPPEIWDLDRASEVRALHGPKGTASLAWSADGLHIAAGDWEGRVWVWDPDAEAPVATWTGHTDAVTVVAWSLDSKTLASGSWDHTVRLWDGATGVARPLSEHRSGIEQLVWSPDGRWIAAGAKDGNVRLWEAATGREVALYAGHRGAIQQLTFTADGGRLISAGRDGAVAVWAVPKEVVAPLLRAGKLTNLRACPGTDRVVAVVPFPSPKTVWAPDCGAEGDPGGMTTR